MSLKKFFLRSNFTYKIYLYYNLYIRHKCFLSRNQYSQWGEDLIIKEFFKDNNAGIYFDVGCFHPIMYSNTCALFKKGWRGINIDINPTSVDLFNIVRPNDLNLCTTINENPKEFKIFFDHPFSPVNTLDETFYKDFKKSYLKKFKKDSFVGGIEKKIKSQTIDEILKIFNSYDKVDFLNIDVEGMDLKILRQLIPHKLTPSLISIETHSPDSKKLRDCDEINRYLIGNNYAVFKRVGPTTLFSVNK